MRRWTTLSETDYMTTTFMIMITRAEFSVSRGGGGWIGWLAIPLLKKQKVKSWNQL